MKGVLVAVLTIGVVMKSAQHHRPAGRTTCSGGEGIFEKGPVLGQGVNRWGLGNAIAVATQSGGLIIGDEKNDIFLCGLGEGNPTGDRGEDKADWLEHEWESGTNR